jgi:orotate phosphoribosyltransferase
VTKPSQPSQPNESLTADFIRFMLECGVLKLGSFKAKSGRQTPYFLDAGRYGRGAQLARLGGFYADRLLDSLDGGFDVLFGPAIAAPCSR